VTGAAANGTSDGSCKQSMQCSHCITSNTYMTQVFLQWPDILLAALPNTVHSCSQHARLTLNNNTALHFFQNYLLYWKHNHSFSHRGPFWNTMETLGGARAVHRGRCATSTTNNSTGHWL